MNKFMNEDFLLSNRVAKDLYENYAKDMPIIDYHCHLNPKEIYENKKFKNITEIWLYGDHYKWRLMRANGIDEKYITGDGSDYDKFMAWAKTVPMTIGNPLYEWTHLELQRYFGIYEILNEKTAPAIWEKTNALLNKEGFGARDIIKKSNVEVICTTDDPVDNLEYHIKLKKCKDFDVKVIPAFRPDKGIQIEKDTFLLWIDKLSHVYGKTIKNYDDFLEALESRVNYFHANGCRLSDHALDNIVYRWTTKDEVSVIFNKAIHNEKLSEEEIEKYKTYTLIFLGRLYSKLGWAMQLHINALRNNNSKMFKVLGPDTGYDSINDNNIAYHVCQYLNTLEMENSLPKTIVYSLNPNDNYVLGSIIGSFQGSGIPGKMQLGSAWWFNDNKDGILEQLKTVANTGLLSRFVGMLTDSRSFLSYTRHEYFRRLLCNLIGEWVENGEVPYDMELLGKIVKDICYYNAKEYFKF
ncbi:glucuronate isomerase [Thermoanaerobacterium sp. RBIITD]|uniref:glucuronate isomerase n=1 Tax=Thermoanaerobacterium sp. RBIITD TaxID=1550240 RepID=UPI000BB969C8|nr:glucuronate isomerase [Thermoanaerobacterium sp. RBIITD]SNX53413.1 glucuronate isomerase [Thermoanaerobacterium sp. RBIITD]